MIPKIPATIVLRIVLILIGFMVLIFNLACASTDDELELNVIHINDLHGYLQNYEDKSVAEPPVKVGGADYIAAYIKKQEKLFPGNTLLLNAGDIAQGTPVSNLFRGAPVIDFMNYMKFDAMCLGNHEFDWGLETLKQMIKRAKFPVLCANIIEESTNTHPDFVKPYHVFEIGGEKIGIIGLLIPTTPKYSLPKNVKGLIFQDPVPVLKKYVDLLHNDGVKIIGVLSHLGLDRDLKMPLEVPGIAFIVSGHSHIALKDPQNVNGTVIVQAGAYGMYVGSLHMRIDRTNGKVLSYDRKNELIAVIDRGITPDEKVKEIVGSYYGKIKPEMEQVLGNARYEIGKTPLPGRGDSPLGNLVTDILKKMTKTDVFFYNSGGLRAPIQAGRITKDDIFKVLPFDDYCVTMKLKGSDLMGVLRQGTNKSKVIQVSGISFRLNPDLKDDERISDVLIDGRPLESDKYYNVGTIDFLFFGGDDFHSFRNAKEAAVGKVLSRDLLYLGIKEEKEIPSESSDKRIIIEGKSAAPVPEIKESTDNKGEDLKRIEKN